MKWFLRRRGVCFVSSLSLLSLSLLFLASGQAPACQRLEPPDDLQDTLWIHIEGPCLSEERRALALTATEVLNALELGKNLHLQGVVVVDDVMFDHLPVQSISQIKVLPSNVRDRLQREKVEEVRVIPGDVYIRNSEFEKVLATNLVKGTLIFLGKVDLMGSVFKQSVDFSRSVFVGPLNFSKVGVDFEGFFIEAVFEQSADFSHVTFGTHSRFHKAVFRQGVTFSEAKFDGVAEFLEVEFQQDANFFNTTFASGTGFSGSKFHGPVDFSKASAKREIYFRFAEFRQMISFRQAQFQSVIDFSNARFDGGQDFSEVTVETLPELTGSNLEIKDLNIKYGEDQKGQLVIFVGLSILVVFYLWNRYKTQVNN